MHNINFGLHFIISGVFLFNINFRNFFYIWTIYFNIDLYYNKGGKIMKSQLIRDLHSVNIRRHPINRKKLECLKTSEIVNIWYEYFKKEE